MEKELDLLEKKINEQDVIVPLEFIIRAMKVMELAEECLPTGEQKELLGNYAYALNDLAKTYISDNDLELIEDNELLGEL